MSKEKGFGIDPYAHNPEPDFVAARESIKKHIRSLALANGLTHVQAHDMADSITEFVFYRLLCHPKVTRHIAKAARAQPVKKVGQTGADANKQKADDDIAALYKNVQDYLNGDPARVSKGTGTVVNHFKRNDLTCGYKDSTLSRYVGLAIAKYKDSIQNAQT